MMPIPVISRNGGSSIAKGRPGRPGTCLAVKSDFYFASVIIIVISLSPFRISSEFLRLTRKSDTWFSYLAIDH